MRLEIKRALSLHKNKWLSETHLFNNFVDMVASAKVEEVMADIPPEYLSRFRAWVYGLPAPETLINLKTGPISEREKDAIEAIRDWLDRHAGEYESNGEADAPLSSPSDASAGQPVGH
jgi:hypothetical protein